MGMIKRNCDNCGKEYNADTRNLRRGWGRCCCKSCAAQLREKNKPGYNPERVAVNNARRKFWADCPEPEHYPLSYDGRISTNGGIVNLEYMIKKITPDAMK